MCWGLKGEALLPPLGNNIRRRKDARNEMRADVLDYVGFGTMQLRFTIFTKLFHSVQFLTIRQSQRRIRFHRRKKQKTFSKKHWLDFNAIINQKSIHVGEWSQRVERAVARHIKSWGETRRVFCVSPTIICFARVILCKGAKAPLQPCRTVQLFIY